jgi:hypothetical protein
MTEGKSRNDEWGEAGNDEWGKLAMMNKKKHV